LTAVLGDVLPGEIIVLLLTRVRNACHRSQGTSARRRAQSSPSAPSDRCVPAWGLQAPSLLLLGQWMPRQCIEVERVPLGIGKLTLAHVYMYYQAHGSASSRLRLFCGRAARKAVDITRRKRLVHRSLRRSSCGGASRPLGLGLPVEQLASDAT